MAAFMEAINKYVHDMSGGSDASICALTALVKDGEGGGLMALVTALGTALTHPDERMRERGTACLSEVLHKLPSDFLTSDVLAHLLTFFSDRLNDYPAVGAVLRGLLALGRAPLSAEEAINLTLTLAESCDIRSLIQAQRHDALKLSLLLVEHHWVALKPSGCRVLMSFLRAIDGEKVRMASFRWTRMGIGRSHCVVPLTTCRTLVIFFCFCN